MAMLIGLITSPMLNNARGGEELSLKQYCVGAIWQVFQGWL